MRSRRTVAGVAALAGAAALGIGLAPVAAGGAKGDAPTYRVTIENLTGGQALTPPIAATHAGPHLMFEVGRPATNELVQIAENGDLGPMGAFLSSSKRVAEIHTGAEPQVPAANPGGTPFSSTATFEIDGKRGHKRISWAAMLICTNDGFTGVDGLRLPKRVGQSVMAMTAGYDAGSEANTEDFGDLVPPCQALIGVTGDEPGTGASDPALATNDVIGHHPGITGREDLVPAVHSWTDPVAEITVTRID
jgi:hypothetical protein